jgi:TonB family protein
MVVRTSGDRRSYAQALLAFADAPPIPALVSGLFRRRHLGARVDALSSRRPVGQRARLLSVVAIAAVMATVSLSVAAFGAQADDTVYSAGNGVSLPIVVTEVKPEYTPEARRAKIAGSVALTCIVGTDGTPGHIEVVESLDTQYGLDNQAIAALEQWRFKPGVKQGKPVAVRVTIEMKFTLK